MKYPNSEFLKAQFTKDGNLAMAALDYLTLDGTEYRKHLSEVVSAETLQIRQDRAAYRCMTWNQAPTIKIPLKDLADVMEQLQFQYKVTTCGFFLVVGFQIVQLLLWIWG